MTSQLKDINHSFRMSKFHSVFYTQYCFAKLNCQNDLIKIIEYFFLNLDSKI